MQINRMFEIVYLLLNHDDLTASKLAARFEVSTRTIYRDIDALCQAGIPIYTAKGRSGGIRLMEGFVLNKSLLSSDEQAHILSGLQALSATHAFDADKAASKLGVMFNKDQDQWISIDFSDWNTYGQESFATVQKAILQKKRLRFDYYSSFGEHTQRLIEPLQLWFKSKTWYVRAFCVQKQALRIFRLSRMRELMLLDETFVRSIGDFPPEPDPLPAMPETSAIDLTLHVDASQAFRVMDEFDPKQVSSLCDGCFLVKLSATLDAWLFGYLLSFGPCARILHPQTARQAMKDHLDRLSQMYKNE